MPSSSNCRRCGRRRKLYGDTCAICLGGRSYGNATGSIFGKIKDMLDRQREASRKEFAITKGEGFLGLAPPDDYLDDNDREIERLNRKIAREKAMLAGFKCAYCGARVAWGKNECSSCGAPRVLTAGERQRVSA